MLYKIKDFLRETSDYSFALANLNEKLNFLETDLRKKILKIIDKDFNKINKNVECPHYGSDVLSFLNAFLETKLNKVEGVVVEAGVYAGGLTCKMSLILNLFDNSEYYCFDTFEGMPKNNENHQKDIYGRDISNLFKVREYYSSLENTKNNIRKFGNEENIFFRKGLFENTMKDFNKKISVLYIDCDLAESNRTVLKSLYKNVSKEGYIISQDAHIPLVINLLKDENFWSNDLGEQKPNIKNLGKSRIICFQKN